MNKAPTIIRVFDIIGGPLAIAADDGELVYDAIASCLRDGREVVLSFADVKTIIAIFLITAIGQLYGEFPEARIRTLLSVLDLQKDDRAMLDSVMRNANQYYENPAAFTRAWEEEVGHEDCFEEAMKP